MDSTREPGPLPQVEPAADASPDAGGGPAYRTEVGHYHRTLIGAPWIAGLLVVPALLAALSGVGRPGAAPAGQATPTASTPSAAAPAQPSMGASAGSPIFEVIRDGKTVTLSGQVPDAATRTSLVDAVKKAFGTGVTLSTGKLVVKDGVPAPEAGSLDALATALAGVGGVLLDAQGGQVFVSGVAATEQAKTALLDAVKAAYPTAAVGSSGLLVGDAAKAPESCDAASAYVQLVTTQTRIQFSTSGTALTADSLAAVKKVADAAAKCPDVKLLVSGNTDNKGSEATNQKLSEQRAAAVKAVLVKDGVADAAITTEGLAASKPIASNDTDAGRALNRRVDITVQ